MAPRYSRNPIESAITLWYQTYADSLNGGYEVQDLVAQAPKRWTAYGPMILLPAGSFTSPVWREVLRLTTDSFGEITERREEETKVTTEGPMLLWRNILDEIARSPAASRCTHLAINEGIPLHVMSDQGTTEAAADNILRSPSGLQMLYGDFGPAEISSQETRQPIEEDFSRAFWVSTKQSGITQTWAPRWTMFSRGNIKEKARILDFHFPSAPPKTSHQEANPPSGKHIGNGQNNSSPKPHRIIPARERRGAIAVDLYAGIGYFALCYASLGFRVLCWELNPWSVEGLRRGAIANGWDVRVVAPDTNERFEDACQGAPDGEGEDQLMRDGLAGGERIIVFAEDNARAAGRIRKLHDLTLEQGERREGQQLQTESTDDVVTSTSCTRIEKESHKTSDGVGLQMKNIMHVNLGFLPSSEGSWSTAWDIASESEQVWVHIHENVGAPDIERRKGEIEEWFTEHARKMRPEDANGSGRTTNICVEHVELVKTFAPGVWHCVFDLYITR
ncbi:S-adenosyl-L-methionine-dependent methyltransferase [Xylariaceae sp. FL0255]|nr:S-adenosyl-L-methionine-dependent methyltransferase [Xylariaceae sp. FL0255]